MGSFTIPIPFEWLIEEYVEALQGVEEQVKDIERELRLMHVYLKHVEALECLGERDRGLANEMTEVAQNARDAIDTFELKTAQRRTRQGVFNFKRCVYFLFSDMADSKSLLKDLERVENSINDLLDKRKIYGTSSSTSRQGRGEGLMSSMLSELIQKFKILTTEEHNYPLHHRTRKNVSRVANECKHLLWLLKDLELLEQDERLKVWMKDIEDLIRPALEFTDSFMDKRKRQIKSDCIIIPGAIIPSFSFDNMIQMIEAKIREALHRKWAYGIGDIIGKEAESSTVENLKQQNNSNHSQTDQFNCLRRTFVNISTCFRSRLDQIPSQKQVKDEVESICRDLRLMEALRKDIRTIDDPDGILNAWVKEVKYVANDVVTIIEKTKEMAYNRKRTRACVHMSIYRIRTTIDTLCERRKTYAIQNHHHHPISSLPVIEGNGDDIKAMMASLLSEDNKSPCVISIVCKEGTSISKYIYDNSSIVDHFPSRAFVSVPQDDPNPKDIILEEIVKQVIGCQKQKGKLKQGENPNLLDHQLFELLENSRYLIVLDGVHKEDTWNSLKHAFPDKCNGSKVVLTTGNINLASIASQQLQQPVNNNNNDNNESSCDSCSSITKSLMVFLPRQVLKLEYWNRDDKKLGADLPLNLSRCLLYFELFPENYDIPARRLFALWVAEGLVHHKKGEEEPAPEDVAEKYLKELIKRNIVQVVKQKVNGKVRTCKLYPGEKELWLSRAKKDLFHPTSESTLSYGVIRRLADHLNRNDPSFSHIHGGNSNNNEYPRFPYRNLLSFLSFDTREEGSKPGDDVGMFLYRCISTKCLRFLRVLDLEGVLKPKLPKEVGKLILMRYLGLRRTKLDTLPSFITNLLKLQTLDLKHTYITNVPISIWKMQQLRHLYLSEDNRTRFVNRPKGCSLSHLQTLWGVYIDEDTRVRGDLDSLLSLRKLGLACRFIQNEGRRTSSSSQLDAVANWVRNLQQLESLRLRSRNQWNQPWDLHLNQLSGLNHLSSIDLDGKLKYPALVTTFPHSLTELNLSATELTDDPMRTLDKLPNLKFLRLSFKSYIGNTMVCIPGSFPQLQVVKIWNLKDLKVWTLHEGALPALKDLEIRSCLFLEMLPDGLHHITTLEALKFTKMPETFTEQIEVHRAEDWYQIVKIRN